ncbi:MAG: alanine--tRNA ligase [Thermoplasmatota archaeon]
MAGMEKEYQLEFFAKNGFSRKICTTCKTPFWTQDATRLLCGDPPCVEYEFIGKPITKREYTLREMREAYLRFFEERGHTRVKRYPVVARWRDDIYLTIASIADFQPHVTSGLVPPPANPLTISQPCIRLNDLDSVGKSGRHLTTFEMMAHHAFNYPGKKIYWKERCIELCHEFLTKQLGIDGKRVTYKEKPWAGGGNAGAAFEVLVGGLEVGTLVFMNLVADPNGPIELYGDRFREMDTQIVDTGYGLERLTWASNGRPTVYDAVFPDLVREIVARAGLEHDLTDPRRARVLEETAKLAALMDVDTGTRVLELRKGVFERLKQRGVQITFEELLGILEPLERVYAVADHARCLAFMLGDGIVPSNVKAGYLTRLIIRRTLRLMDELKLNMPIGELIEKELDRMSPDFPELKQNLPSIRRILELETQRFRETLEKGRRLVERDIKGKGTIGVEQLVQYYDSQGMPPDVVRSVAAPLGVTVDVPDDFYTRVAKLHSKAATGEGQETTVKSKLDGLKALPSTKLLYYESSHTKEFDAVVLWAKDNDVVLDQTAFYPEGGGQPADTGFLITPDRTLEVTDVQKIVTSQGTLVVHKVAGGKIRTGEVVRGRMDWGKRLAHTRHHTATHIVIGATRRVLGPHIWQAGAQKGAERSRIDVTHYQRITDDELREIEQLANMVVLENLPVEKVWLPRDEAEKRYGMQLFQGGIPEGKEVRVVRVLDFDVECCGGTHVRSTNEVGPIKILKSERVQDGVERLEFSAGLAAVNAVQRQESTLREAAEILGVTPDQVPKAAQKFFDEWKLLKKEVEKLSAQVAGAQSVRLLQSAETIKGTRLVANVGPMSPEEIQILGKDLSAEPNVIAALASEADGMLLVVRSDGVTFDLTKLKGVFEQADGRGGGKPDLLRGKIAPDKAKAAIEWIRAEIKKAL